MAINKVVFGGSTLIDITDTTATASDVLNGKYFYAADGSKVQGTATSSVISIVESQDSGGGTIIEITGAEAGGSDDREDLTIPKDVDFIDYDGRLLYSYTAEEFLALEQLPANPSNKGLTAQGWNWTLTDAKNYVQQWGTLVIGQSYITTDGKTRIYINVTDLIVNEQFKYNVVLYAVESGTGTIAWGDGATSTIGTGTGSKSWNHLYTSPGNYIIEISITSGSYSLGYHGSNQNIVDNPASSNTGGRVYLSLQKVEIGSGITGFGRQPFHSCFNLKSVTIPKTVVGFNDTNASDGAAFESDIMRGIVFPSGFQGKSSCVIGCGLQLRYISVPKSTTIFSINSSRLFNLRKLTLYSIETASSSIKMNYSKLFTNLVLPGTYTTLASNTINGSLIKEFTIPVTVTTIQTEALIYNYFMVLHVLPTSVPAMGNVRALNGLGPNSIIYVPYSEDHSILEAYQTATNWSSFASYMQEEPQ